MTQLQVNIPEVGQGKVVTVGGEALDGVVSVNVDVQCQDMTTVTVVLLAKYVDIQQTHDV